MAVEDPVKLGIHLKGRDLETFKKNLIDPPCTPDGLELVRLAQENARKLRI